MEAEREWLRLADQSNSVFVCVQAQVQTLQQLDSKYLDKQVKATPLCWLAAPLFSLPSKFLIYCQKNTLLGQKSSIFI